MGARIFTPEAVLDIRQGNDGTVAVKTDRATYSAARVIVTAGPWMQKLLGAEYSPYFKIYRQVMCWFALARNAEQYTPARFPVFIWIAGNRPRDMLYGFPAIDGPQSGVKIATEQYEATVDPDAVTRTSAIRKSPTCIANTFSHVSLTSPVSACGPQPVSIR